MGLFQWFSTKRKLAELESELNTLKASWRQVEQDWDATSARISKVLRRMAIAERRRDDQDQEEPEPALPLTTVTPTADRMARIREQLAAKGRS